MLVLISVAAAAALQPSAAAQPQHEPRAVTVSSTVSADGTHVLVHEQLVPASAAEVWQAVSTAEGWKSWAVPVAWLEGDLLETSYDATARRGDSTTIRQQILASVAERLIVFRTIKAPAGFPHFDSFRRVIHKIELEPVDERRTLVRLTGAGYADDAAGRQLLRFFTAGNRISLDRLRRRFEAGPIDWPREAGAQKPAS